MSTRKVGIVGAGFIAKVHARAWAAIGLAPAAFLYAEPNIEEMLGYGATPFEQLEPFLDAVDVVDICAPTHLHAEFALAAAAAGRATICEMPLCLTTAEGRHVLEAFERAQVPLGVGHQLRFTPEYRRAREAVMEGRIGTLAVLRLARLSFAPKRGPDSWYADAAKSGGIFFDLMIHDLDYARWVGGEVSSVFARLARGPRAHAIALLQHSNGAITHVEASWAQPEPVFRTSFEIAGSTGIVSFDSDDTAPLVTRFHHAQALRTTGFGQVEMAADPFVLELAHFVDVVQGRAEAIMSGMDGVKAVEIAAACQESSATGKPVALGIDGEDV